MTRETTNLREQVNLLARCILALQVRRKNILLALSLRHVNCTKAATQDALRGVQQLHLSLACLKIDLQCQFATLTLEQDNK